MAIDKNDFIGGGLEYPLKLVNGGVKATTGLPLLRSALKILLSWDSFTRFFLYEYGNRIREVLEEPNDDVLEQVIRRFTIDTIDEWEKRVVLQEVTVIKDQTLGTKLSIQLDYTIINTNVQDSFIFPFYEDIKH